MRENAKEKSTAKGLHGRMGFFRCALTFGTDVLYRKEQGDTIGDEIADDNEDNGANEGENALAEVLSL